MIDRGQQENQGGQEQNNLEPVGFNNQADNQANQRQGNGEPGVSGRSNGRSNRGFAAMDPERQKAIASEGGRAAHRQGVAHEWSSDEARQAGRKGGQIVSQNREHMSEIGRRGGQSSGSRRSQKNAGESQE